MKILIYGGAFNPVHYAHLNNIRLAYDRVKPDLILVVPNNFAHFKDNDELCDIKTRAAMLKLALNEPIIKDLPIEISLIEQNYNQKLYTYDLIKLLKEKYEATFYFLIGSDHIAVLDQWYKIDELLKMVEFIVIKRDDALLDDRFINIDNEVLPYQSTLIRNKYESTGITSIDNYIREHGLYLKLILKQYLSTYRLNHSIEVAKMAVEGAKLYNLNTNKAYIAGMLHDIAKELPILKQYELINGKECFQLSNPTAHAYAAISIIESLGINDKEILSAISKHTTAAYEMSLFDKLIYVSDMLCIGRDFSNIEYLRKLFYEDLNICFNKCFKTTYQYLKSKNINNEELEKLNQKVERNEI